MTEKRRARANVAVTGRRRRAASAALLPFLPACAVVLFSSAVVLFGHRSPTRLTLDLSWAAPSVARPFGSGDAGVDVLAVASYGTLRAIALALLVALSGFVIGTPLGTAAALQGGIAERWTARAADLVQSFPTFLLALAALSAVRTPSRWHMGLVFIVGAWAPFARLALVQARAIAAAPFVEATRALGGSFARALFRHVLPNVLGPVAVQLGSVAAGVVLGETALGFVGLGPPDGVSLGALLEQGTAGMLRAPHVLVAGALAVMVVSGSLQVASEGVRRWVSGHVRS
jgi:ABC-type dipeptide/oligopeptide/nickel transport system permease subunit